MKTLRPLLVLALAAGIAVALGGCGTGADPVAPAALTDNAPPQAPTGLVGGRTGTGEPALAWSANSEPDLAGYQIYQFEPQPSRENAYTLVATLNASVTEWPLPGVSESGLTWFRLRAVDGSGNRSAFSAPIPIMLMASSSGDGAPGEDTTPLRH